MILTADVASTTGTGWDCVGHPRGDAVRQSNRWPTGELQRQPDVLPLITETDEALQHTAQAPEMDYPVPIMPWHLWRISIGRRVVGPQTFTENVFEFIDADLRVDLEVAHTDSGEWRTRPLPVVTFPGAQLGELPIRDLRLGPATVVRIVEQHRQQACVQPGEGLSPSLIWAVGCRDERGAFLQSIVDGRTGAFQSSPPRASAPPPIATFVPPRAIPPPASRSGSVG